MERVGEVAAAAARYRHLCQWAVEAFVHADVCLRQTPEPAAVAEPAEAAAAPEMPEKAVQEPKAAQLPQATEPPEPEDDEPELTPEQRAAAERRKAEITRTVQVSIEQIEDAEAEQAEKEADTPESTDSKVGRAVRLLIGWLLLVVLLAVAMISTTSVQPHTVSP